MADPDRVAALINYESVLHEMKTQGADIEVILPSDGVISADYPLSPLANPEDEVGPEQTGQLIQWLNAHADEVADTFRRPAVETELHPDLTDQVLIELPFPAELSVTDRLIDAYNNELRVPGEIIFVLDVSGSMAGARLADLQETMLQLIDGSASTTTAAVGLRDREQVTILPFASDVNQVTTATIGSPGTEAELRDSVEELVPEGGTALYSALQDAYGRMSVEEGGSILSLVLLTDGEVTEGPDAQQFGAWFEHQEADLPPTFVIRYGEADPAEMQQVAELTGGQLFDAGEDQLSETSQ